MFDLSTTPQAYLSFNNYSTYPTLANASGGAVITITAPDGTTSTPTVANAVTGVYTCTGPTSQAGRYTVQYVSSGTNGAAITDTYDVKPAASLSILSLGDAKATLNMTKSVNDAEVRDCLDAVTSLIEGEIGAVIPRTVTETVEIWRDFFMVKQPIISLTSLTPVRTGGMTLTASDYQVLSTGKVIRKDGAWVSISPWNQYTAVYQAGRSTLDPRIMQAARVLLQHLWAYQRGNAGTPRDTDAYTQPFTMPNSVREALSRLSSTGIG